MATYRYIRWVISKRRSSADYLQAMEFQLRYTGSAVAWNAGTLIINPGGEPSVFGAQESASALIDGSTSTKWGDAWFGTNTTVGTSVVEIDTITQTTFDGYRYATGNDNTPRDPVSWKLYGSNDYTTWDVLDEVNDATITTSRSTYTQIFPVGIISQSFAKVYRYSEPIDAYTDITWLASNTTGSSTITFTGPQVY